MTKLPLPDQMKPAAFDGRSVLRGMRRLFPFGLFVIPFGVAYGIAATEAGMTPLQATVMSAFVFTAIAQFAALDFAGEPGAYLSMGLVALALSGRHIVMGAALSRPINQVPPLRRFATLALLNDANFADTQSRRAVEGVDVGALFGAGLILWAIWWTSTALGAYGGDVIGDTEAYGFHVVMSCFFAATVANMVRPALHLAPAVIVAIGVSVLTEPYLPTGWNVILAAIVGGLISLGARRE
ncbi:MAG: AzlC family ABC transporter permease [Pseudomonadota bacterium]